MTRYTDGSLSIYPERLIARGRRARREAVTTVRLDLRVGRDLADALDLAASAAGMPIDVFCEAAFRRVLEASA